VILNLLNKLLRPLGLERSNTRKETLNYSYFGRGFNSHRLHHEPSGYTLRVDDGDVTASTGYEFGTVTSRVVWPTYRDTQRIVAKSTVVSGIKAKVLEFGARANASLALNRGFAIAA
jgi:hypothetical protein